MTGAHVRSWVAVAGLAIGGCASVGDPGAGQTDPSRGPDPQVAIMVPSEATHRPLADEPLRVAQLGPISPMEALGGRGAAGALEPRDLDGVRQRAGVDPLEPVNRRIATFNDAVDRALVKPVAQVYDRYAPEVLRLIARNVLSNLLDPYIALNSFLQGKPGDGFNDLARFVFNTTLGFFGFGDPASEAGYAKHREDFGQTMGVWGVPPGPYIVLPFLGPSNVRDTVGFGVDAWAGAINRFDDVSLRNTLVGTQFLETRAQLLPAERLLDDALDRYLLVRDGYLQRRRNLVYDGNPPDDE